MNTVRRVKYFITFGLMLNIFIFNIDIVIKINKNNVINVGKLKPIEKIEFLKIFKTKVIFLFLSNCLED